jgi:hypothetical protein
MNALFKPQPVRPEPVEGPAPRHTLASTGSARTVCGVAIDVKLNKQLMRGGRA